MSASLVTGSMAGLRGRLTAVLDELATVSLDECADAEIVELGRECERSRRRLDPVEQRVIGQVQVRSLAFVHGCKTTVDFARHLLTIGPGRRGGGSPPRRRWVSGGVCPGSGWRRSIRRW